MDTFIQQLLNGLVLGSLYALIALGYTMVYGILRIINFAHGDLLMIGALVGLSAIHLLQAILPGCPDLLVLAIATVAAMAVCAVLAGLIERVAYRRLRNAPRLAPLISGLGVSLLLQTVAMLIWSRNPLMFPQLLPLDPIELTAGSEDSAPAITNLTAIATVAIAATVMGALLLLVNRTRLGRAMRAVAENPQVASLMGINPNTVIVLTFAIGGALAALAGVMMASNYGNAHFYMGFLPGLKAFTAAVLGGIGNIKGAMLGGILLGLIEALGTGYLGELTNGVFGSNYQDVFAFMVLIAVLVLRPSGLLGERLAVRA
ncbi:branched-chain amino acid ABC transporter permease [Pseudomonas sp. 21LCFQ02]|uniref:branched-chain amino acid ABC transporter permease n=1 Tax=unclassified Pseudomonas TaxID=196821 RepID=UPI0004F84E07|nr:MULTISPECIES: branched-chain amino acid ABC transporter permease [unclassified Pseudomonas]MCO8164927.1 branched-chain amino acid ABC transporter permease [Pseudomonas sp. 21LCFQ010]MCO8169460.1 branched-chain amino acid ABC transporter permease [Pseudomonas sp. 21LCFQ02]MCQ9422886.1 branched-chain amino acid ABC transporter permease [Pseudomonas sp. LJDD11]BAP45298.1 inner-membrane translocator [Pseudomonas sp. StFLB209]